MLLCAPNGFKGYNAAALGLPPADEVVLRFAIVSDGHFGQRDTAFEAMHQEMVDWLNLEYETRGIDFSFINGDIYHDDKGFIPGVKASWDSLSMPYHVAHGNHDHCTEAEWHAAWEVSWDYGFVDKATAFVVLNTADAVGAYICPDLQKASALLTRFEGYGNLFVFMHITPVKWTGAGIGCPELVELFAKQQNLRAVFHGHDHDEDDMKEAGGKPYFFDSHIGGNWGTDYRGYRIVEVLKNGDMLTYQFNPAQAERVNSHTV